MRFKILLSLTALFMFCCFAGCNGAGKNAEETEDLKVQGHIKRSGSSFHKVDLYDCTPVDHTGYEKKVDNFMVVFDPSASMTQTVTASQLCMTCHDAFKDMNYAEKHSVKYGGREFANKGIKKLFSGKIDKEISDKDRINRCSECHQGVLSSKLTYARNLVACLNDTIPDFEFTSALRTLGYPVYTKLGSGPKPYDRDEYSHVIRQLYDADGASPLWVTLRAAAKDWYNHVGKIAVIIFSDGMNMGEKEVLAAEELKLRYRDDVCIYTVQIGYDADGGNILKRIADAGQCGGFITGAELNSQEGMESFVRQVFLKPGIADSDGDGVPDNMDDCPDTEPGVPVDGRGCWKLSVVADVLFDFDKFVLRPEGKKVLDKVATLMNKHPYLNLHLSGHTDNYGSMKYNIKLSKNRTYAGLRYLKKCGISPDRISVSWHAFSLPVATNATDEGRQQNRRLEFKFKKVRDSK